MATPDMVTIPAGLALLVKGLQTADGPSVERATDLLLRRCEGDSLTLVRAAFLASACLSPLAKTVKRCLDNAKTQLNFAKVVGLLIAPPARGKVDVADPLRKALIADNYGAGVAEVLSKYADNPPLVEASAMNVQYLYANPASWDAVHAVIFSLVAPLASAVPKSGASATAVAACVESLAFLAHVDVVRKKGDWQVVAKLADLEFWMPLVNVALGKHGRSGRVAAAVMTLLRTCASSPKATNHIRGMATAGLLPTAVGYMRRSVAAAPVAGGAEGMDRSLSPARGGGRGGSPSRPGTSASSARPGTSASTVRPGTSASSSMRQTAGGAATMSATRGTATMGGRTAGGGGRVTTATGAGGGPSRPLRTYADNAWGFAKEVALKTPEILLSGEPEPVARLLLIPLLSPVELLPHARHALSILAPLLRMDAFLSPFLAAGGIAVLSALVTTLLRVDPDTALAGLTVLMAVADLGPACFDGVLAAGGFEAAADAYYVAWELHGVAPGSHTHADTDEADLLRGLARTVVRLAVGSEERRARLAGAVAGALDARKGDIAPMHVVASACLIAWSASAAGADPAPPAAQAAGAGAGHHHHNHNHHNQQPPQPPPATPEELASREAFRHSYEAAAIPAHLCGALRAFPLDDALLGPLLTALRSFMPPPPAGGPGVTGPAVTDGGAIIFALVDVVRISFKRESSPDMVVWTVLFQLLEDLIFASPSNRAAYLRYPGLLPVLSRALEWAIRACDAEEYKQWRLATRPPPPPEEDAGGKGPGGKAGAGKKAKAGAGGRGGGGGGGSHGGSAAPPAGGDGGGSGAAADGDGGEGANQHHHLVEVAPQWIPARIVRLVFCFCGESGATASAAQARAALVHRKVGEYVWPWVLSITDDEATPGSGISPPHGLIAREVDGGVVRDFLTTVWRVGTDGPYQGWEETATPDQIRALMRKFPSWKPDPSYLE
jgi:uncharacterized membrane protein YgcG